MTLTQEISAISGLEYFPDKDLTSFTTMRLQSRGDLVEIYTVEALQQLLPLLKQKNKKYLVVGWGANQILPAIVKDLVIHLKLEVDPNVFSEMREEYHLPASIGLNHLTSHAVKFGLKGWEVFTGIPASLGGAVYMNAGTNLGEIGPLIKKVDIVTAEGEFKSLTLNPESFTYRKNHFLKVGEVIVGAVISHRGTDTSIPQKIKDYLEYRKKTQPLATKNCGCVFKNPMKELQAGRLIDTLGLKGLTVGGLRISPKHANFIENTGASNWDEFSTLVDIIKSNMDRFYGIEFELEVKIPYH